MRALRPALHRLYRLIGDRRGATAIEYGLICALIVLAAMGAIKGVAGVTVGMWNNTSDTVQRASR